MIDPAEKTAPSFGVSKYTRCAPPSSGFFPFASSFTFFGELGLIYQLAPIVFMGGSLVRHGGQNPIEAIKFGAAILHGHHVSNFDDIYEELDRTGAAVLVTDADKLTMQIGAWIEDGAARQDVAERAKRCVDKLGGALDLVISALEPYFMQLRIENHTAHA